MWHREATIQMIKFFLLRAQHRMKVQADQNWSKREFAMGDWVWLKLQPYRQQSLQFRANHKLSPKYYGPSHPKYYMLKKVASHCSDSPHLPCVSAQAIARDLPRKPHILGSMQGLDVETPLKPVTVLDRKMVRKGNRVAIQSLVQWEGQAVEDATLHDAEELEKKIPKFNHLVIIVIVSSMFFCLCLFSIQLQSPYGSLLVQPGFSSLRRMET